MAQDGEVHCSVRLLHIEDHPLDAELIAELLREAGLACTIRVVCTQAALEESLAAQDWDLILSDLAMPGFDGLSALNIARRMRPATPFIFVSGTMGEDYAVESLKLGATDYVLKRNLTRLVPAVNRALRDRTELLRRLSTEAQLKETRKRLQFLVYHDDLTELGNRRFIQERLPDFLAEAQRYGNKMAVLLVDLDEFKLINDSMGHSIGDLVLKSVGERIKKIARQEDLVARTGGDEFVIVLKNVDDYVDAAVAADRINYMVAEEIVPDNHCSFFVTCSIGISFFPENGCDTETLLKNADAAMYAAKEKGGNIWHYFTDDLNQQVNDQLKMQSALRRALSNEEFFLVYQPQYQISTSQLVGAEALLRWQNPTLGCVAPNSFIPVAEKTSEILAIGKWVLQTACKQAKKWENSGNSLPIVAVNVSALQFRDPGFLTTVKETLAETGLAPERLELEVTETMLMEDAEKLAPLFRSLREMGVQLAIDDFGTGYCGLDYVRTIPFSKLKIDRRFVESVLTDSRTAAVVKAVVNLARDFQMAVVAECVETVEQATFLHSLGCENVQGYLTGPPMTAEMFEDNVLHRKASPPPPGSKPR